MTTLAVRNKNPLNIRAERHGMTPWQGQLGANEGFCVFKSPAYGFRAAIRIMRVYAGRGLTTVHQIVDTWAPPNENNTPAYVAAVCRDSGLSPNATVGPDNEQALVKAMAIHESGGWFFSDADLAQGISLA